MTGWMPTGPGTAASMYGAPAPPQPVAAGGAAAGDTTLSMGARTTPAAGQLAIVHRPTFWLVVLVAVAVGLISFSVRVGK